MNKKIKCILIFCMIISLLIIFIPLDFILDPYWKGKIKKLSFILFGIFGASYKIFFIEKDYKDNFSNYLIYYYLNTYFV